MAAVKGRITSLGNYVTIDTTIVREDGYGRQSSGMFDQQKERFIEGLKIGDRSFGRMSCPTNLYPYFEKDKEAILYTWLHPFLGWPPIRTGIIGIAYPEEQRAVVMSMKQVLQSLLLLALMPLLWLIPAILVGGLVSLVIPYDIVSAIVVTLVALSPWIAGGIMVVNYFRMRAAHPYLQVPD